MLGSTYRLDQQRILQRAGKTPEDGTASHTSLPNNRCRDLGSGARGQAVLLRGAGQAVFGLCVPSPSVNDCVERKKEDLRDKTEGPAIGRSHHDIVPLIVLRDQT